MMRVGIRRLTDLASTLAVVVLTLAPFSSKSALADVEAEVAALLERARRTQVEQDRSNIAVSLAELGRAAVPAVLAEMKTSDRKVVVVCLVGLRMMRGAARDAEAPIASLLSDRDEDIQQHAVLALRELGQVRAETALLLLDCAAKTTRDVMRLMCVSAVQFSERGSPRVTERLRAFLKDAVPLIRAEAVKSMYALDPENAFVVRDAIKMTTADVAPVTRATLAAWLGRARVTPPEAVPALRKLLSDQDAAVRGAAVEALGELGFVARQAIPELESLAARSTEEIRLQIERALASIR
jgi:HEAT repeat protein